MLARTASTTLFSITEELPPMASAKIMDSAVDITKVIPSQTAIFPERVEGYKLNFIDLNLFNIFS